MDLWDRLLPQALLTLNLLRGSRINPKLSAFTQVNGIFDFNRTPVAPPGIRVLVHDKPSQRRSWSPHASDAWYCCPAFDSYRCYLCWMVATRALRISDTAAWLPYKVTMPTASSVDLVIAGTKDILHALQNPSPGSPLAPLADTEVAVLKTLTDILLNRSNSAEKTPALVPTATVPPGFDPLPTVALPLTEVPRVDPTLPEVPRLDLLPTAPTLAAPKSPAKQVRFARLYPPLTRVPSGPTTSIPVQPLPHLRGWEAVIPLPRSLRMLIIQPPSLVAVARRKRTHESRLANALRPPQRPAKRLPPIAVATIRPAASRLHATAPKSRHRQPKTVPTNKRKSKRQLKPPPALHV